ncbi:MAG: GH3 auxin-responsive promoter family protein [Bacteroidota bacterium]
MRNLANNLFRLYYQHRFRRIEQMEDRPHDLQQAIFRDIVSKGQYTEWGELHGMADIRRPEHFAQQLPVTQYEDLHSSIDRMMRGERDVLWPGRTHLFSKSSGTTSEKSKFIPVSPENFKDCHIKGTWDTMTLLYNRKPDCRIFAGKNFLMAGNHHPYQLNQRTIYGDVSALMIRDMPRVARPFFEPDFDIVLRDDWESKIQLMAQIAIDEEVASEITMVGGVPTWVIVFFRHILEQSGKDHMLEVWPNFEAYIHGGVNISPYMEQLKRYLPADHVTYFEVYNASEGYFGSQYSLDSKDMLLLLDNGVYYEFLPMEEWDKENPQTIPLEAVETGKNYALVITTNAGLWRYLIGDTICFSSTKPYTFRITGRTQQFINVFGEEVMISNTDKAIAQASEAMNAIVSEYTVAPIFLSNDSRGGHEWLVEFEQAPVRLDDFARLLDQNLQALNSDYEAKRYRDMALQPLQLHALPKGSFHSWLRAKGRYGGQSKIPRLSNSRSYLEEILAFSRSAYAQEG